MLGIRLKKTPEATILKIGFGGDVCYVYSHYIMVGFCCYCNNSVGLTLYKNQSINCSAVQSLNVKTDLSENSIFHYLIIIADFLFKDVLKQNGLPNFTSLRQTLLSQYIIVTYVRTYVRTYYTICTNNALCKAVLCDAN